jgi:undecaprenyl-diphosphatase
LHNDYLVSAILGIVEGITEFLPVSSTAHLRLAEALFGIDLQSSFWKFYSIFIQLGAILCVPIYFRHRIWQFLRTFPKGERGNRNLLTHPLSLTILAFVVTAIPAYLLKKVIGKNLERLDVIGAALLIGGAVMWGVDALYGNPAPRTAADAPQPPKLKPGDELTVGQVLDYADGNTSDGHRTERMDEMTLWQAIWIGACQLLAAVFPGTSRSMATIAAGELAGMSRTAALEFSFFLAMPTMLVATLHELKQAISPKSSDALTPAHIDGHGWVVIAIGFVISFFVAWVVVAWFMNWVRRRGFAPFAIYRIALGIGVLLWARHLAG